MSFTDSSAGGCRVYWGSHGCCLPRGHDGDHLCWCTYDNDDQLMPHGYEGNVGRPPYYGPETRFYGEDAEALGLPLVSQR